jgi:hypothetical protein
MRACSPTRTFATHALLAEMGAGWPATAVAFFALAFAHLIDARVLPAPTRHLDAMRSIFGPVVRRG